MYFFFDTETTGLPLQRGGDNIDPAKWPRMVQLAWLLFDENGKLLSSYASIIKPVDFTIPKDASEIHGITTDRARKEGMPLSDALVRFLSASSKAKTIVAHNLDFDLGVVKAEFMRGRMPLQVEGKEKVCTMQDSTGCCGLPDTKWPKLGELYFALFGRELDGAHDAASDARATAECFFELKRRGVI